MYFTEHLRSIFYVTVLNSPLFKRLVKYRRRKRSVSYIYSQPIYLFIDLYKARDNIHIPIVMLSLILYTTDYMLFI